MRPATTIKREGREEAPGDAAGWPRVPLGELCNIAIGKTPSREQPRFWGGDLTWAAISDLKSDVITRTAERITAVGAAECRCRIVPSGTLLFSFKLTIGKMAFAGCDLYTNEAIAALTPLDPRRLDKHYLRLALAGTDCAQDSSHAVKGKTLNQDGLRALSIPLPPLAEQERMAGRLTKQLAAVERARAAAQARLAAAEALPAAYLREVFEGPEASGLPTRLGDICEVVSGFAWSAPKFNRDGRGLPVIRIQNVDAVSNREFLFWEHEFEDRFLVRHGELLLTLSGSFRVAAWDGPLALLNQRIVKIVPSPGLDVLWFLHAMRVRLGDIEMMGKDALVSNVSINDIRDLEFELPPLPAQRRIAADLARRLGEGGGAEHLAACIRAELAAIETLPAALLRAAFGGEPGPEHEAEA